MVVATTSAARQGNPSSSEDDIHNAFLLVLGRKGSPAAAVKSRIGRPATEVIRGLLASQEFEQKVLIPIIEGTGIPHDRRPYDPSLANWILAKGIGGRSFRSFVRSGDQSWSRLVVALLADASARKALLEEGGGKGIETVRLRLPDAAQSTGITIEPDAVPAAAAFATPTATASEAANDEDGLDEEEHYPPEEDDDGEGDTLALDAGDKDAADVELAPAASNKLAGPASDDDIYHAFTMMLGRIPDDAAVEGKRGMTLRQLMTALALSSEFAKVAQSIGAGTELVHDVRLGSMPNSDVVAWANDLFEVEGDYETWLGLLTAALASDIAMGEVLSPLSRTHRAIEANAVIAALDTAKAHVEVAARAALQPYNSISASDADVTMAHRLFLSPAKVDGDLLSTMAGLPLGTIIRGLAADAHFGLHVVTPLLQRRLPEAARALSRPGPSLVEWIRQNFILEPETLERIHPNVSWYDLLSRLLSDKLVSQGLYPDSNTTNGAQRFAIAGLDYLHVTRNAADAPQIGRWSIAKDGLSLEGELSSTLPPRSSIGLEVGGLVTFGPISSEGRAFTVDLSELDLTGRFDFAVLKLLADSGEQLPGTLALPVPAALLVGASAFDEPEETIASPYPITLELTGRRVVLSAPNAESVGYQWDDLKLFADGVALQAFDTHEDPNSGAVYSTYLLPSSARPGKPTSLVLRDVANSAVWKQTVSLSPEADQTALHIAVDADPALAVTGYSVDFAQKEPASFELIEGEMPVARARADRSRPAIEELKLAPRNVGFTLPLPSTAMDGETHTFTVDVIADRQRRTIATIEYRLDADRFDALAERLDDAGRLSFLEAVAVAGRTDLIERQFTSGESLAPADMVHIATLLFARRPDIGPDNQLRALHNIAWARGTTEAEASRQLALRVCNDLLRAQDADEGKSLVISQTKESVLDICLSLEPSRMTKPEHGAAAVEILLSLECLAAADAVIGALLRRHDGNPGLLVLKARVLLARGQEQEAVDILKGILARDQRRSDAISLLARARQAEGDFLSAIDLMTNGRGVAVSDDRAPSVAHARASLPLGWTGFVRKAAAGQESLLTPIVQRWDQFEAEAAEAETFSVFYADGPAFADSLHEVFESYGEHCLVATTLENDLVNEAAAIGDWVFVLRRNQPLSAAQIESIWQQRRWSHDLVIIETRSGNPGARSVAKAGFLVRSAHLNRLGKSQMDAAISSLSAQLSHFTVLLQSET
ncbi:MAG TPA: hypothetical protein VHL34_04795 [Rhizomicrobium sp.]|nr:hypothetical protein [Rhizomicrobium sp.]